MIPKVKSKLLTRFAPILILVTLLFWSLNFHSVEAKKYEVEFNKVSAHEMVTKMGRGTNLGNTFEGNWNSQDYGQVKKAVNAFIAAGYTNIRIPINWGGRDTRYESTADEFGHFDVKAENVKTVKKLVDYVLHDVNPQRKAEGKQEIIVIINTHHEAWAMDAVTGEEEFEKNMQRLETIWMGISDLFKDAPETLLFEFFNEPQGKMNSGAQAKASVIEMNKRLYDTIRNYTIDGKNPHEYRNLIFGGNNYNSSWGLRDTYRNAEDLPGNGSDKYIIGTYHSYFPNVEDHLLRIDQVANEFVNIHNVPIYLGEFRYDHRGNITDELKDAYRQIANKAIECNMAFSVWDDNGWYQIYDRSTKQFNPLKDEVLGY